MRLWKQIARESTGSEIAEAAFVLPLVFALLFAIVWFGRVFNIYATLNRAAHEGAQAAAVTDCATCRVTTRNIRATVIDPVLTAAHVDPTKITNFVLTPVITSNPTESIYVVSMTYRYDFRLNGITCCPLTLAPINLGIDLNAHAQTRQED